PCSRFVPERISPSSLASCDGPVDLPIPIPKKYPFRIALSAAVGTFLTPLPLSGDSNQPCVSCASGALKRSVFSVGTCVFARTHQQGRWSNDPRRRSPAPKLLNACAIPLGS